jgi:Radial spoke protein 3
MTKLEEIERRKKEAMKVKERFLSTHKWIHSRSIAKTYLSNVKECALGNLRQLGAFRDNKEYNLLSKILPALYGEVRKANSLGSTYDIVINNLFTDVFKQSVNSHAIKIQERERQVKDKYDKIQEDIKAKAEARKKRKEEKEAERKRLLFIKFKESMEAEFIKTATPANESIIFTQMLTSADGYLMKKPVIASIGGIAIDIIAILTDIVDLKGNSDFLNEKSIMLFFGNFLTKEMKGEGFPVFINSVINEYLKAHSLTLTQINEPDGAAMVYS